MALMLVLYFSTVKSFIELLRYILRIPGVKFFLSERLSQDPLENFFGCQRQRCRTNENPNLHKFCKNTQALRVINSVCGTVSKGNCRGNKQVTYMDENNKPLPKRRRVQKQKSKLSLHPVTSRVTSVPSHPATSIVTSVPLYSVTSSATSVPSHLVTSSAISVPSHLVTSSATSVPSHLVTSSATSVPSHLVTSSATSVPSHLVTTSATSVPSHLVTSNATSVPSHLVTTSATSVPSHLVTSSATSVPSHLVTSSATSVPLYSVTSSTSLPSHPVTSSVTSVPLYPVANSNSGTQLGNFNGIDLVKTISIPSASASDTILSSDLSEDDSEPEIESESSLWNDSDDPLIDTTTEPSNHFCSTVVSVQPAITWLQHSSVHEGIINKVLGPGAADEELSRGFGIVLRRQDFWTLKIQIG